MEEEKGPGNRWKRGLHSLKGFQKTEAAAGQLYRAVVDCMLREELNLSRGAEFAGHVKTMVAANRFHRG